MLAVRSKGIDVARKLTRCQRWQRFTLQSPTTPTTGETTPTFTDVRPIHGQIVATGGSERLRGRQVDATVTHMVTVRFADDIEPTWRLRQGSRYYNIVAAYDPDGSNQYLEIQLMEARP